MVDKKQVLLLNKNQKEAIGLLSIGTFLEYFDLMLYVHMAVLLNELFFPKTDPYTASLLAAFAFCSTFVFRPLGALVFGWLGDNIGRKATVTITTIMMSISCFIMANLPTYEQIGITAAWLVTLCRIFQGMSSMGEVIGAELYVTEVTKPPIQYPAVALIGMCATLGGTVALSMASFATSFGLNWRIAFWFAAGIGLIGILARTRLRETPDFVDAKRRIKSAMKNSNQNTKILEKSIVWNIKSNKETLISLFFVGCSWPVCFYIAYIYCGNMLKSTFGFVPEQVIHQNFMVSIVQLASFCLLVLLSYKIYPLKIIKFKITIFLMFCLLLPYLLLHASSPTQILLIQSFIVIFGFTGVPAAPIFYKHFPVFTRFTSASFAYALSRAVMHVITSFGIVYLTRNNNHWGILIIIIPVALGYIYGINHFENLEIKAGNVKSSDTHFIKFGKSLYKAY